jgi:N-terminal domain of ribose phosphate pyrophosphokinase
MILSAVIKRRPRGSALLPLCKVELIRVHRNVSMQSLASPAVAPTTIISAPQPNLLDKRQVYQNNFQKLRYDHTVWSSTLALFGVGLLTMSFALDLPITSNESDFNKAVSSEGTENVCYPDNIDNLHTEVSDNEVPNYGSSSDPMPDLNGVNLKHCYLSPIDLHDVASNTQRGADYVKSVRAFETVLTLGSSNDTAIHLVNNSMPESHKTRRKNVSNEQTEMSEQNDSSSVFATSADHNMLTSNKIDHSNESRYNGTLVSTKRMYFAQKPKLDPSYRQKFVLLGGPSSEEISWDISQLLGMDEPNRMIVSQFNDGECRVQIQDSVRGKRVFLIQSTNTTESLMELMFLISTLRRASAKKITAVIPYYGYCRQDERRTREPIAAADVALLLEIMGVDQIICVDLHSDSLRGFFPPTIPVEVSSL